MRGQCHGKGGGEVGAMALREAGPQGRRRPTLPPAPWSANTTQSQEQRSQNFIQEKSTSGPTAPEGLPPACGEEEGQGQQT